VITSTLGAVPARALDRLASMRLARHVRVDPRRDLVRLGTEYGGYVVPGDLPQSDWICYSGGIGEDASFELELIDRYGCEVVGFDPTPRSIRYMEQVAADGTRFRFMPVGLWSIDTEQRFYAPANPEHVSHSITTARDAGEYFVAQCRSVPSLMAELGHERVDLLKLDIEGAEYEVLDSVLESDLRVKVLLVDFHRIGPVGQMAEMADRLRSVGYRPVHLDRTDLTFVDADLV
jgi:FkbM family methyltransferase